MQFCFGKRESKLIKGVAIVAMFYHHFFGFPSWLAPECDFIHTYIFGVCVESVIASFCKICVGLYAFTSGYALFMQNDSYKNIKSIIKRAFDFLKNYWSIFLIFILFGFLFNEPFPPVSRFLLQCFGVSTATGFNWDYFSAIHPVFAWYVSFYLMFLFFSPYLSKICKNGFIIDTLSISSILFGGCFIINSFLPSDQFSTVKILLKAFAMWGHIGMIGFLFAKYNIFSKVHDKLVKHVNPIVLCMVLLMVLCMLLCLWTVGKTNIYNSNLVQISALSIYTPISIYAIVYILNFIDIEILDSILIGLSKESTNMWFLHGLFFTPNKTIQWIAFLPRYPIFILIWTLFIMYCCSRGVRFMRSSFSGLARKIFLSNTNLA